MTILVSILLFLVLLLALFPSVRILDKEIYNTWLVALLLICIGVAIPGILGGFVFLRVVSLVGVLFYLCSNFVADVVRTMFFALSCFLLMVVFSLLGLAHIAEAFAVVVFVFLFLRVLREFFYEAIFEK